MKQKRITACLCLVMAALLVFAFTGCAEGDIESEDIIILYTNDIHCGIKDDIGYAGLATYKKALSENHPYVTLVDCGDHLQGSYIGAVSKGECIVEIMNEVGYDFAILGNHEFDYGMEQLGSNMKKANAQYLNCNITYSGSGENVLSTTKPYEIVTYGKTKVAFIGVSTPKTIINSTPVYFMENGEYVYSFAGDEDGSLLYETVQKNVDACRKEGADYVILLSHLGVNTESDTPYTSQELVAGTTGIDVVLDAHSHVNVPCWILKNKTGDEVKLSSAGSKLNNIGQLVITDSGFISVGYIETYEEEDTEIRNAIESITQKYEEQLNQVVAHIDMGLSCTDENGIRMVRSRELPIGDLVADAYRIAGNADIGMCNGGGIRADLAAGDIAYKDIISVCPYGNSLCVVKVTGAELLDMLEYFYRHVQPEYVKDGKAWGEDGSFQQVSGLKFTIDTAVESSVEVDEADALVSVGNARRVSDVQVLENGEYCPIDPERVYTVASQNYMIKEGGCGMALMLKDHELVVDESVLDYQMLIDYISALGDGLYAYTSADDRIILK